jgi:hypothetical protein
MATSVQDTIRRLKGHLCKCEESVISAQDAGDAHVLDGADLPTSFNEMLAAVKNTRAHLDEAHKLIAEMRHNGDDDNDGDDDNELSFAGRSRRLDVLDRDDVGAVPRLREVGGAYLAYDMQADAQRRLDAYWGMK